MGGSRLYNYRREFNLLLYFRGAVDELVRPKLVLVVLNELDEGDKKSPRMRPVHNQPLQQNPTKKKRIYDMTKRYVNN